jgi:hypothetical protein
MTAPTTDTAPAPPPASVQDSNARQALRALELLALERAATRAVTAPLRVPLVAIQRMLIRMWLAEFGSLDAHGNPIKAAAIATRLRGELSRIDANAGTVLDGYVQRAVRLGVDQAAREVGVRLTVDGVGATADDTTARIVAGIDGTVTAAVADAESAAAQAETYADLDAALGKARRALPKATSAAVTAVNGGANAGKRAVAEDLGVQMLWLAEPDCCTTCAGFAGRLTSAGEPFDAKFASTFTDKPHIWPDGPVEQPPAHPHCRCELVPWLGTAPGASGPSLPEVLQREARRAIYKGWSLPSESQPERIRAARKLLARNTIAPASVKDYSRRAVKAGRFPTRNVPHYTPKTK